MDGTFDDIRIDGAMAQCLAKIMKTNNLTLKLEQVVPIIEMGGDNLYPFN